MTQTLKPEHVVFKLTGDDGIGEMVYELKPNTDINGLKYRKVGDFLSDDDFYQGLNMVTVIQQEESGKLYGYFWWDDISKHGESYIDYNGYDYGLESEYDDEEFTGYAVWVPVEEFSITAYKEKN